MSKLASEISNLRLSLEGKNRQIVQQAVLIEELEELVEMMKLSIERKDARIKELESGGKRWSNTIKEVECITRETELMKRLIAEKDRNEALKKKITETSRENSKLKIEKQLLHDQVDRITRHVNGNPLGRSSSDRISSKYSISKDQGRLPSYKSPTKSSLSKTPSGSSLTPLSAQFIAQVPISESLATRPPNPSPPSYLSISPDPQTSLQADLPPFSALNSRKFPKYDIFLTKVDDLDSRKIKKGRENLADTANQRETKVNTRGRVNNAEKKISRKAVKFEESEDHQRRYNIKKYGNSISKRYGISNFDAIGF